MAAGRSILFRWWWWIGCVLTAAPLLAQDAPADASAGKAEQKKEQKPAPPAVPDQPAPTASSSTREFRPSEEVSPDQEVDFPADL